jgi:hypothetical protein
VWLKMPPDHRARQTPPAIPSAAAMLRHLSEVRTRTGLSGLAVSDRFGGGKGVRLFWSAGSALGSRCVFAGVVLRGSAFLSVGVFAGHASFVLVSRSAWLSWHTRGQRFEPASPPARSLIASSARGAGLATSATVSRKPSTASLRAAGLT